MTERLEGWLAFWAGLALMCAAMATACFGGSTREPTAQDCAGWVRQSHAEWEDYREQVLAEPMDALEVDQ